MPSPWCSQLLPHYGKLVLQSVVPEGGAELFGDERADDGPLFEGRPAAIHRWRHRHGGAEATAFGGCDSGPRGSRKSTFWDSTGFTGNWSGMQTGSQERSALYQRPLSNTRPPTPPEVSRNVLRLACGSVGPCSIRSCLSRHRLVSASQGHIVCVDTDICWFACAVDLQTPSLCGRTQATAQQQKHGIQCSWVLFWIRWDSRGETLRCRGSRKVLFWDSNSPKICLGSPFKAKDMGMANHLMPRSQQRVAAPSATLRPVARRPVRALCAGDSSGNPACRTARWGSVLLRDLRACDSGI